MDVLSIVIGFGALIGGAGSVGTVAYWHEVHSSGKKKRREEEIRNHLLPLQADLQGIHAKLDELPVTRHTELKAALHEAMEPVRDQLAILNTKVEPLWTALINMGINQTNVLHQPDPRRAQIDRLLEALQEELRGGQRMNLPDFIELRRYLEQIKEWEPGQELDFPVLPAEPTSAAVLLAIMGLSRKRRDQG